MKRKPIDILYEDNHLIVVNKDFCVLSQGDVTREASAFDLVKELRSGWRAFWYQTTARAFKINLKREFKPTDVHEDYLIEDILQRAFAANRLKRQKSVLDYDYASLSNKWKTSSPAKN